MKKLLVAGALALGAAACAPEIAKDPRPEPGALGPVAPFDPSATPPVVPTPNEAAMDPATGLNRIPLPANATPTDTAFVEYLSGLDGFPAGSSATAYFNDELDPATVNADTVKVFSIKPQVAPVTGAAIAYQQPPLAPRPRVVVAPPVAGWASGGTYGVALTSDMKTADGKNLEATATWLLVRSADPLVQCPGDDLKSPLCRPTTGLIPSDKTDPTERANDQRAKAIGLEGLRRMVEPMLDALESAGTPRSKVVLAWSFKIASNPTVAFDPGLSRIPTPTDLVISGLGTANQKVAIPVTKAADGGYANANDEFNDTYLNTLDGFPASSTGTAAVVGQAKLNASTVSPATVVVLNITNPTAPAPCGAACTVTAGVGPGDTTSGIEVRRTGGWAKGSRWAVAVTKGVTDTAGKPVEPSTVTWQLVRSTTPVATCATGQSLLTGTCTPNFNVSALTNAEASRLELLRQSYAPLFAGLAGVGVQRNNVAVLWTFSIMTQSEMVLDLASGALPFPVSIPGFTTAADGGVQIALPAPAPLPDGGVNTTEAALVAGLNTLDGFSPTAPILAENSATAPAIDSGDLDTATFKAPASGVLRAGAAQAGGLSNTQPDIVYVYQNPAGQPNTVAWAPRTPLDERTRYLVYTTNDVKTTNGKALVPSSQFALLRLKNPLRDANGNSTVSVVPAANAAQFEALRQYWNAAVFGPLESTANIPRSKLVHAFPFHTLSTVSQLVQLRQVGLNPALPNVAPTLADVTAEVVGAMTATGLPTTGIGKVFYGTYASPYLLTGPGGAFNPGILNGTVSPRVDLLPFLMFVPSAAAPTGGYELTVFGHGLGGSLSNVLPIASRMNTEGRIVVGTDWALHGERTICVGAASSTASTTDTDNDFCRTGSTCNADATSPRFGRCIGTDAAAAADCNPSANGDLTCARARQGRCLPTSQTTGKCEGGDFVRPGDPGPGALNGLPLSKPAVSGWNMFSASNPFATRDNFRQHIVDLTALTRTLRAAQFNAQLDAVNGADVAVNTDHYDYAGISLGGILGTTFTAASDVRRAGLNVPGGDLVRIILDAPAFAGQKAAILASLGLTEGTPAFARFENVQRWVLDPADPVNAAHVIRNREAPALPAGRDALVQYITNDQVVPNTNTVKLILAGSRANPLDLACWNPGTPAAADRHGFLLNFADPAVTSQAQVQLVDYLNTGTVTAQATQGTCPAALPQ